jgi:phosphate transport system substrate-binding protein
VQRIAGTALALLLALAPALGQAADIAGAGATFPYPIYAKWADAYKKETGIGLNYQSIGSGGGIKQIQQKTVTFGASDMPLEAAQLDASGLMQFPMIMGGVVPVLNVRGIAPGKLELDGPTLAQIFLGTISKWNDPRIAKLNPGVVLPAQAIALVHRADGSGTTFLFTDYLSKVSPEWKEQVGAGTAVQWPAGIGAKGNEGVANMTGRTDGAVGYVEYAYAKQNKMTYVRLLNRDGKVVSPESSSFQAAAANADWAHAAGFHVVLTDQPGPKSWPITGASFILIHKQPEDPAAVRHALDFFAWAYAHGAKTAETLDYVPMPQSVIELVEKAWTASITTSDGKSVWTGGRAH